MRDLRNALTILSPERILLERCRQAVDGVDPSVEFILYGSRARGDARPDSDYDLLILSEGPIDLEMEDRFRRALYPIELDTGMVLTVMLIGRMQWASPLFGAMPFVQNVLREGVRL